MTLSAVDWAVIVAYVAVSVAIALVYARRALGRRARGAAADRQRKARVV